MDSPERIAIVTTAGTILSALISTLGPPLLQRWKGGPQGGATIPRPWPQRLFLSLWLPLLVLACGAGLFLWYTHRYEIRTFRHGDEVGCVAFSADGGRFVSGSKDQVVRMWDADTGREVRRFRGCKGAVTCVALSPDDQLVFAGSQDKRLRVWEVGKDDPVWEVTGAEQPTAVALLPGQGRRVLVAWQDRLAAYNFEPGQKALADALAFEKSASPLDLLTLSTKGDRALTGSAPSPFLDSWLQLWDVKTGQVVSKHRTLDHMLPTLGQTILCLAFSPDGRYFASGNHWEIRPKHGTDVEVNDVVLWDVTTWEEVRRFSGHGGPVTAVAFTPDGRHLVSGSEDGSVRVWDRDSGEQVRWYWGHRDWFGEHGVTAVAVDPKQGRVLSASRDKTARLWEQP